jgi:anhydro-N-acetylmuramic acid kinase
MMTKTENHAADATETMTKRDYLLAIGAMTGNSLDGVDVVLTRFGKDGSITDLKSHSVASPAQLTERLRTVREVINTAGGDMEEAVRRLDKLAGGAEEQTITRHEQRAEADNGSADHCNFNDVQNQYIRFVAGAINELIALAKADAKLSSEYDLDCIDLIGFHGQTCAHFPPSIARTSDPNVTYTVQIGDGQALADLTGIPVVYDFRSDDLMHGGEGAPLAPVHHQHLAEQLRKQGRFPIAFCNAGNTGNFTIISCTAGSGVHGQGSEAQVSVLGWDAGPFNNYPDRLVQLEQGEECDRDGKFGSKGRVNIALLERLFDSAVITQDGRNYLLEPPPKSSDPQWYRLIPELTGEASCAGERISFEDRLRTAEYFSAYIYVHALTMVPEHLSMPRYFALCGGGWKNPVAREHFAGLLRGDFANNPVLECHKESFEKLLERLAAPPEQTGEGNASVVAMADDFGFDGTAMEARIFADAAVSRVIGQAFTRPSTTGVERDTVCGIIRFPGGKLDSASANLRGWLEEFNSRDATVDRPDVFDGRWSRASAGWHARF